MPLADDIVARLIDLERRMQRQEAKETPRFVAGPWTPAFGGDVSDGTISYTTQYGRYVRMGPLCWITGFLQANVVTSAPTNDLVIRGLPFTAVSTTNQYNNLVVYSGGLDVPVGALDVGGYVAYNSAIVTLFTTADAAAATLMAGSALGNSDYLLLSGWYEVA